MFSRRPTAWYLSVCLLAAFFISAGMSIHPTLAVSSIHWSQQGLNDFEKGKPEGVAVTAHGGIVLARAVREIPIKALTENAQPFLWSEVLDSKGNLFVGSGNDGKVFEIPKGGQNRLLYSTGDLAVQALAIDSRDNLYVGTSPKGRVYRITPKGEAEVWFEPEERYIWSMVVDQSGNLFVATGEQGIIYKVAGKGEGTPFFDSEESHIVALTLDAGGSLLAGSSGKGLLYRIGPNGRGTVILDSPLKEVNAVLASAGAVYAAAIDTKPLSPLPNDQNKLGRTPVLRPGQATVTVVAAAPTEGEIQETGRSRASELAAQERNGQGVRSVVYRIDSAGIATSLWESQAETVFSMTSGRQGEVYLGTGDQGKIRRLEPDGTTSLVARVDSSHITALVSASDGGLFAAGSNSGKLFILEAEEGNSGTFVSPTRDATTRATWGQIGWRGEAPPGTKVELFTRSGNSALPDGTWSDWSSAYLSPDGNGVVSPSARFIQWKAHLSRQVQGVTPLLEEVTLAYLPANLPPEVKNIEIHRAGVVIQKPLIVPESMGPGTAFSEAPQPPEGTEFPSEYPVLPGKKVYQRGMRSLSWTGTDPNHDSLRYDLFYRGDGEQAWKPLARGIQEGYFAWDSTLLPDDRYRLKIVATDAPSNPAGGERKGEEISPSFVIDNTPPRVDAAAEEGSGGAARIRVADTTSPIRRLEYSIDAAPWILILPGDGVADSSSEEYRVPIDKLSSGEHTLLFKATDAEGNVGTGKLVVFGK